MKIIVLAGGADQIALILELKKRGHKTILIDYFENPPAKQYADLHIVASTLDVSAVENIAREHHADMICTACTDQALLTVAKVSEKLELPCYISYQTALNVTNKSYMKKRMIDHGIPTSKYKILCDTNNSFVEDFCYPLVVKPVDCNSSKGVVRVDSSASLEEAIQNAIHYSRTNTAIVEEFKVGDEVSADFYVEGNTVKLLCATTSKKVKNSHSFTIIQSYYPVLRNDQEIKLTQIAQTIADVFDISDSPLLVQMIVNGDDINVLEFSARMGGGSKYKLIEVLSGVNIMETYVDLILGEHPTVTPRKCVDYAASAFIYCQNGVLHSVTGLDRLTDDGIIDHYFLYKTKGMAFTQAKTSGDRAAGYIVTADNEESLKRKLAIADARISVLDENGKDIMIHGWI